MANMSNVSNGNRSEYREHLQEQDCVVPALS